MSWGFITPNISEARPSATSSAKGTQGRTAKVAKGAETTGLPSDDEANSNVVKTAAASETETYIAHPTRPRRRRMPGIIDPAHASLATARETWA